MNDLFGMRVKGMAVDFHGGLYTLAVPTPYARKDCGNAPWDHHPFRSHQPVLLEPIQLDLVLEDERVVEAIHYVKGNGTRNLARYRVRTPTFANIPALVKMLQGCKRADVPRGPDPLHRLFRQRFPAFQAIYEQRYAFLEATTSFAPSPARVFSSWAGHCTASAPHATRNAPCCRGSIFIVSLRRRL